MPSAVLTDCARCGSAAEDEVALAECPACSDVTCEDCVAACTDCGSDVCRGCVTDCRDCRDSVCSQCIVSCWDCAAEFCDSCATSCVACGDHLCDSCVRGCGGCGDSLCSHCACYCDSCDESRCSGCACDCDERVHAWDYRPRFFRPKGDYPAEALLGVELEVGGRAEDVADAVSGLDPSEDHLYLKHDGSIAGVEIVTHPMTLGWARQYAFAELLRSVRAAGGYVADGYGLHVHVSRNAFRYHGKQSAPHQMRWLLFIYRNAEPLKLLARRESAQWAAFKPPACGELARKATAGPSRDSRYVAVNCNNDRTFELRFFAATLDETEFWAAVEFADASVRYTATLTTREVLRGGGLSWSHFTDWVRAHNYPNLLAELGRQGD